jgi:hypothetical protein
MEEDEDIVMMRQYEISRYQLIKKAIDRDITQKSAAEQIGLTDRQTRRIVKRVKLEGEKGVVHKSRGREGTRHLDPVLKQKILSLYLSDYSDFGPTLASEKFLERHKIRICEETLRLWLIREGLWRSKKLKSPKHFTWRARKDHLGEMVQMDGSHHDWLEGRGPRLVLMGYIDDATSKFHGSFHKYEGTLPAMISLDRYIQKHGIPRSMYLDKHATYKNNRLKVQEEQIFKDPQELTQFGRACSQLGIKLIHAHSPQAKGRIERVFETLQDRLVKELRLAKAKTIQEANAALGTYLDTFNEKFMVEAKSKGDLHRQIHRGVNLKEILSVQNQRTVRNDRTVLHENKWYQITTPTGAKTAVIHEYWDGRLKIRCGTKSMDYRAIEGPAPRPMPSWPTRSSRAHNHTTPKKNHPWKRLVGTNLIPRE